MFVEDDVFRIIVPLDDAYSFDYGIEAGSSKVIEINNADKIPINADKTPVNSLSAQQNSIIQFAKETGSIKSRQVEEFLENWSIWEFWNVKVHIKALYMF